MLGICCSALPANLGGAFSLLVLPGVPALGLNFFVGGEGVFFCIYDKCATFSTVLELRSNEGSVKLVRIRLIIFGLL